MAYGAFLAGSVEEGVEQGDTAPFSGAALE